MSSACRTAWCRSDYVWLLGGLHQADAKWLGLDLRCRARGTTHPVVVVNRFRGALRAPGVDRTTTRSSRQTRRGRAVVWRGGRRQLRTNTRLSHGRAYRLVRLGRTETREVLRSHEATPAMKLSPNEMTSTRGALPAWLRTLGRAPQYVLRLVDRFPRQAKPKRKTPRVKMWTELSLIETRCST